MFPILLPFRGIRPTLTGSWGHPHSRGLGLHASLPGGGSSYCLRPEADAALLPATAGLLRHAWPQRPAECFAWATCHAVGGIQWSTKHLHCTKFLGNILGRSRLWILGVLGEIGWTCVFPAILACWGATLYKNMTIQGDARDTSPIMRICSDLMQISFLSIWTFVSLHLISISHPRVWRRIRALRLHRQSGVQHWEPVCHQRPHWGRPEERRTWCMWYFGAGNHIW